jgi:hypothetical protein
MLWSWSIAIDLPFMTAITSLGARMTAGAGLLIGGTVGCVVAAFGGSAGGGGGGELRIQPHPRTPVSIENTMTAKTVRIGCFLWDQSIVAGLWRQWR